MLEARIDWDVVRKRMIDRKVYSFIDLAAATGVNKNTLNKRAPFLSTTADRIASFLNCSPLDILTVEEVDQDDPPTDSIPALTPPPAAPTPKASDAARRTQRQALTPARVEATPQQLAAEAERRRVLLEQAEGRRHG